MWLTDEKPAKSTQVTFSGMTLQKTQLERFLNRREFKYIQTLGSEEDAQIFGKSFPKNLIVNPDGIISFASEGGNENMHIEIAKELD